MRKLYVGFAWLQSRSFFLVSSSPVRKGRPKIRLQAYVWLNIAVSQGEEAAEVEAKKLAEHMICSLLADVAQDEYGKRVLEYADDIL